MIAINKTITETIIGYESDNINFAERVLIFYMAIIKSHRIYKEEYMEEFDISYVTFSRDLKLVEKFLSIKYNSTIKLYYNEIEDYYSLE